jgi:hypothetical protein
VFLSHLDAAVSGLSRTPVLAWSAQDVLKNLYAAAGEPAQVGFAGGFSPVRESDMNLNSNRRTGIEDKQYLRRGAALALAALATCIALSACGPPRPPSTLSPPGQPSPQSGPWADTITGIVNWPDGSPLANAQIQFYPQGTDLTPITETTGPDGSYTSRACAQITCSNLQAWFSGDNSNGFGDLCNIQLSTDLGSDQGFTLEQGQVNWVVNPQNCDQIPGIPDTSHPLTWQQAEGIMTGTLTYDQAQADNGTS